MRKKELSMSWNRYDRTTDSYLLIVSFVVMSLEALATINKMMV